METISLWLNYREKSFLLYQDMDDMHPHILYPGICIRWDGRDEYVKIVDVIGHENDKGPHGFTFLPWRKEGHWATPQITFRGDARFVICYPSGFPNYGLHIPLHTITVYEAPPEYPMRAHVSYDYKGAMIQLKHDIELMCEKIQLQCVEKDCVFTCSKVDLEFSIYVVKTLTGYKLNLLYQEGSKEEFKKYASIFLF